MARKKSGNSTVDKPTVRRSKRGRVLGTNDIDRFIGKKICVRRNLLGITQQNLADSLQLTFQQVQKYEKGLSKVSSSRLFQLTRVLDIPINYFFEGMPQDTQNCLPVPQASLVKRVDEPPTPLLEGMPEGLSSDIDELNGDKRMTKRETLELSRNYYRLPSQLRRTVLNLCRTLAQDQQFNDEDKKDKKGKNDKDKKKKDKKGKGDKT